MVIPKHMNTGKKYDLAKLYLMSNQILCKTKETVKMEIINPRIYKAYNHI